MKYDARHRACGRVHVTPALGDDHDRGETVRLACRSCGGYGEHDLLAPLEGLA